MNSNARISVVGGGVIGLSVAWRLARSGANVTVFDRAAIGRGAAWSAGGMVGAVSESNFENVQLVEYARASLAEFPAFVSDLVADSGVPVPLDMQGILATAINADDVAAVRRVYEHRVRVGLPVQWYDGNAARQQEPLLSPRVPAAMLMSGDGQVDNRAMLNALVAACRRAGVTLQDNMPVHEINIVAGTVAGVTTNNGFVEADYVVLAAGPWSAQIAGVPPSCTSALRPVKGQIVVLRSDPRVPLSRVVRTRGAYIVPKADGRVLVGATQEEMGFDVTPTAGPLMELLAHAWETMPCIYELPFEGVEVALRPGTRDHMPVVGATEVSGLIACTGHFRHGILLAPATAGDVCAGIVHGRFPERVSRFAPDRFSNSARRIEISK